MRNYLTFTGICDNIRYVKSIWGNLTMSRDVKVKEIVAVELAFTQAAVSELALIPDVSLEVRNDYLRAAVMLSTCDNEDKTIEHVRSFLPAAIEYTDAVVTAARDTIARFEYCT